MTMTMHDGHAMTLFDPHDPLGVAVIVLGAVMTAAAFVFAVRATLWPGETQSDHPKYAILREDR